MNNGYCKCGCGGKTNIAKHSDTRDGIKKGEPYNYINGHQMRGSKNGRWNNGSRRALGYIQIRVPEYNHRSINGYIFEHILICEKILGNHLPYGVQIHHINGKKDDNRNENMVICQNKEYHMLLHRRTRAFKACGHGSWRKCKFCQQYDAPENLYIYDNPKGGSTICHRYCSALKARQRRIKAKQP